jgi:hypothetical protein
MNHSRAWRTRIACAELRWTTTGYQENVGFQFLSLNRKQPGTNWIVEPTAFLEVSGIEGSVTVIESIRFGCRAKGAMAKV